jgi:hypothetical protein
VTAVRRGALSGLVLGAAWFGVLYMLVAWIAPAVGVPPRVGLGLTVIVFLLAVAPIEYYSGALTLPSVTHWAILAVVGGLLFGGSVLLTRSGQPGWASVALLVAAVIGGLVLGRFAILDRDLLLLVTTLYVIVDTYSVFFGPTQAIISRGGPLLATLTVRFPVLGTGRVAPFVGVTDFLVWAACLQAAHRLGLAYVRSHVALALGLLASAGLGMIVGRAVPALPLMMAGFLVVNWRAFRWRQRGLWLSAAAVLVVVVGAGVALRWWLLR